MKRMWMAVTINDSGKRYSYIVPFTESDNVLSVIGGITNFEFGNVFRTKKRATEVVNAWRASWKANNCSLF